jgi:AcrR family transcriptional regulator
VTLSSAHFAMRATGRRRKRAEQTRERLFQCALQLIGDKGLPGVTVEDITETADVGKGTFFNYFQSKHQLAGLMAEIQLVELRKALELARSDRSSVWPAVRRVFERIAREIGQSPELARAFLSSFLADRSVRQSLDRALWGGQQMVRELVQTGQSRGEINSKLNSERVALLLFQAFLGTLLLWSLRATPSLQRAVRAAFRELAEVCHGS